MPEMPKKIKDGDGNLIPERRKNNNRYRYTELAIALLVIAIGWLFIMNSRIDVKVEKIQGGYTEITAQLRQLQNDVGWIKDTLQDKYKK
jgi:hypothetical protein